MTSDFGIKYAIAHDAKSTMLAGDCGGLEIYYNKEEAERQLEQWKKLWVDAVVIRVKIMDMRRRCK